MDGIADGGTREASTAGRDASGSSAAGLDLHLDRPGGRVGDGVMEAIRDAIRSGRLVPGIQLPSSRALAADLGVARNTVVRVTPRCNSLSPRRRGRPSRALT
jgi:Bacterial regulatory proteins, gntR family